MTLLAGENVEREIVVALRLAGYAVADVKESKPGIADADVLTISNNSDAVLITNDKDFGELIYRDGLISKGIILLRFGKLEIRERIQLLIGVLEEHENELDGAFTVISPTGVRIRK